MTKERSNLRAWREFHNLTGAELGERTGLTRSAISRLEAGQRKMTVDYLNRFSRALAIAPEDLMGPPPHISIKMPSEDTGRVAMRVFHSQRPHHAATTDFGANIAGANIYTKMPFKIIEVPSDEMEPTLRRGDHVVVNTSQTDFDGAGIFLVSIDGVEAVRRLQMSSNGLRAICDNQLYGSSTINTSDMAITGKVVAKVSSL